MKSYLNGILTGVLFTILAFILIGANKNRSNEILKLIIEDQKNDMLVKEQVELNESAIKRNQEMIETKFRNIYRYLGETAGDFFLMLISVPKKISCEPELVFLRGLKSKS